MIPTPLIDPLNLWLEQFELSIQYYIYSMNQFTVWALLVFGIAILTGPAKTFYDFLKESKHKFQILKWKSLITW